MSATRSEPARPQNSPSRRAASTNSANSGSPRCLRRPPAFLSAVSSITPKNPASAKVAGKPRSGSWSAISTATSRRPSPATGASSSASDRWSAPARNPSLIMSTPAEAVRRAAAAKWLASGGRSPTVALTGRRPPTALTAAPSRPAAQAPSAPRLGSLRSIRSAPQVRASSTSSKVAMLASILGIDARGGAR